jgi:signal transduction histidine kinase
MPKEINKTKSFSIDARTIINLGRDSIKNPTTALLELVKNSYDADATIVEVEINKGGIRVADNGVGMTATQLEENWLRIGYSEKRSKKVSKKSRRKTGEKGIGRLSTDRLGERLVLNTKSEKTNPLKLSINWEQFNVDGKSLSDIPVTIVDTDKITTPKSARNSGTEILISDLRQDWLRTDIEQVYSELTALISPFSAVKDFEINFTNHLVEELNGSVKSSYYEASEIALQATFDGKSQQIKYKIIEKIDSKTRTYPNTISWDKLSQRVNTDVGFNNKLSCGPVSIDILFFGRTKNNPLLAEKGLSLKGLRIFLDKNLGIKIYRDQISVKPYGYNNEPSGDWLGLAQRKERDPAGLSRETYKVSSHQMVGAVAIGRDTNPQLIDGASREGLIESEAFYDLRALTFACVTLIEKHRHEKAAKNKKIEEKKNKPGLIEEVDTYRDDLENLQKNLEELQAKLGSKDTKESKESVGQIAEVIKKTEETKRRFEELLDNNRVLSGLATVGIAAAVFGHETQTAVSLFRSGVSAAQSSLSLKSPKVKRALEQLETSLGYAKQVSSWGAFAMARVRKDKRTRQKISVKGAIESVIAEVEGAFKAIKIDLIKELKEVDAKVFVMDIESIVLNLLTNAYSACGQVGKDRKIRIELYEKNQGSRKGFEIVVADSGPGVDKSIADMIWVPLFTTKKGNTGNEEGTGLGLTIVKNTVEELGGDKEVTKDQKLKGARFRVWLPAN